MQFNLPLLGFLEKLKNFLGNLQIARIVLAEERERERERVREGAQIYA
ncbi:MAG: hypothetical protein ACP5JH_02860 [Bacteroidota bacterium]